MNRPDLLASPWQRVRWYMAGGVSGGVLILFVTAPPLSCCATASSCPSCPAVGPSVTPTALPPPSHTTRLLERLGALERKLECAECQAEGPPK